MIRKAAVVLFFGVLLCGRFAFASCPVERAPVKAGTDTQASQVSLFPIPATIASLHSIPMPPRPLPHDSRVAPIETTIYSVAATLIAYRLTPEGEIELVLSDEDRRTIVAVIPSLQCAAGGRFLAGITGARTAFDRRYKATEAFVEVRRGVEVEGVGFFDFLQGQRGLAPNGLSLYPVTRINLTPIPTPKAPPQSGRRRAVGSGGVHSCPRPTLSIAVSRGSVCAGDSVTIAWTASNPAARVTIDGLGAALPATGTRTVTTSAATVYSGRATTSCGDSDEALALVTLTPGASASLTGPSSVTSGRTATLSVFMSAASSWRLSSSLANTISPSTGTASGTATYNANRTGNDTVTMTTTGGVCGNLTRTLNITVGDPPTTGGLRCCDGTRSPTCFSCAKKQGCCSSHGGVCGCS